MKEIIQKWYGIVFPEGTYGAEFNELLETTALKEETLEEYSGGSGQNDLLMTLYFCEELEKTFEEKHIPKEILYDTVSDIALWTDVYVGLYGRLGMSEANWFRNAHFTGDFFKLGRLQFLVRDRLTEVHIPACGSMKPELCDEAFSKAKEFVGRYYPENRDNPFICHSWLLDDTLKGLLDSKSNILSFASRFRVTDREESDAALRYVFTWNTTRADIPGAEPRSTLQRALKEHVIQGGKLYECTGILK